MPEALARVKELEGKVRDLILAKEYGTMPAWVVEQVLCENESHLDELERLEALVRKLMLDIQRKLC